VLGFTPWRAVRDNRVAVLAAVLTGLAIAVYTILDGIGVRRSGSPAGYTLCLIAIQSLITVIGLRILGRADARPARGIWWPAAAVCAMSAAAYGLVLWAQTRGTLAAVAAMRETSVVVAAFIGMIFFKEPMGRVRIAASVMVAAGIVLLAAF
jgi:drug/metabolite transporter (DMT)-like permease